MVELTKDKKSDTWIITRTDSKGFHMQMNVTLMDIKWLDCLIRNELRKLHEIAGET